jgi:WD40 repeat protein
MTSVIPIPSSSLSPVSFLTPLVISKSISLGPVYWDLNKKDIRIISPDKILRICELVKEKSKACLVKEISKRSKALSEWDSKICHVKLAPTLIKNTDDWIYAIPPFNTRPPTPIRNVHWSSDGEAFAVFSLDNSLHIRSFTNPEIILYSFFSINSLQAIRWSSNGQNIAIATFQHIVINNLLSKNSYILPYFAFSIGWSHKGNEIAVGGDNICIWDIEKKEMIKTIKGHAHWVNFVDWTNDDKHLISTSFDHTVRAWSIAEEKEIWKYIFYAKEIAQECTCAALSIDSKSIAIAYSNHDVHILNTETGTLVAILQGHTKQIDFISWSPNGAYLATASDKENMRIWKVSSAIQKKANL